MIYTDGQILVGTHEQELHDFAISIGLKREWFKNDHYDLFSGSVKHKAIAAGAVLIPVGKIQDLKIMLEERNRIIRKIESFKGDMFLAYGYVRQQEEIDKKLNKLHL